MEARVCVLLMQNVDRLGGETLQGSLNYVRRASSPSNSRLSVLVRGKSILAVTKYTEHQSNRQVRLT